MRKSSLVVSLLLSSMALQAQFVLSGKILKMNTGHRLSVNIPYIYGYYQENSKSIPVDPRGNFKLVITVKEQKFIYLEQGDSSQSLLLTPGRSLSITLDSLNGRVISYAGTAAEENRLLYSLRMGSIPFFMNGPAPTDSSLLQPAVIKNTVIDPWNAERDRKLTLINESKLNASDKALLSSEIRAEALLQLQYYGSYLNWGKKERTAYLLELYKDVKLTPDVYPVGIQYYYLANSYVQYLETKSFTHYQELGSHNDQPLDFIGISLDSATRLMKQNGKAYISWLSVKNTFDKRLAETYLAQLIQNKYREKDLSQLSPLLSELQSNFPDSKYKVDLLGKEMALKKLLAANASNKEIRVFEGFEKIRSIYDVLKTLKGKVVYLDVWGTWCGPCKAELKFNPQLKKRYKDKDIVFLYLDMDDDVKDKQWREFIRVNGMTGLHLRKDKESIAAIWEELLPKQPDEQYYPSYFIFDRKGKMAVSHAKRPSDEQALYEQLDKVLSME